MDKEQARAHLEAAVVAYDAHLARSFRDRARQQQAHNQMVDAVLHELITALRCMVGDQAE